MLIYQRVFQGPWLGGLPRFPPGSLTVCWSYPVPRSQADPGRRASRRCQKPWRWKSSEAAPPATRSGIVYVCIYSNYKYIYMHIKLFNI